MKRGLKGTEDHATLREKSLDARITPMKRGLKASSRTGGWHFSHRCKDYPDEKGTERV